MFVAGQVPLDENGLIIGSNDPHVQAIQCLRNLELLLSLHGFTEDHIRLLTVYVVGDQNDLNLAWEATTNWFDQCVPPATLLGVNRLGHEGQLVEIDATIIADCESNLP